MLKLEDIKKEILKAAKAEKELSVVSEAKKALKVLTEKLAFYRQQAKEMEAGAVVLDAEIRNGLASGKVVDEAIQKRSAIREKKAELEALAEEVDEVMLPAAELKVADAEKAVYHVLQSAVMNKHNDTQSELNKRLAEIETDLQTWPAAVAAVQAELVPNMPFSGVTITLKCPGIRRAMGF